MGPKDLITKFKQWLNYNRPDSATTEEWVDWNRSFRENAPIRAYLVYGWKELSTKIRVRLWIWRDRIKYRVWDKKYLVNTGLRPDYYGRDTRLFHACFAMLVDWVETETIDRIQFWVDENNPHYSEDYRKLLKIYEWYKKRDKREERYMEYASGPKDFEGECVFFSFSSQFREEFPELHAQNERAHKHNQQLDRQWKMEDDNMLDALVNLRERLR